MAKRISVQSLQGMKEKKEPITMLTCYDYPTALCMDDAGVDIIFIGDSLGTNILGYESPCDVTMEDMLHHTRAVSRGVKKGLVLADMPYMSYETPESALENAKRFIDAGAEMIKLEGGKEVEGIINHLTENGIAVMAHIGHTPQSFTPGGRVVVGISADEAKSVYEDAVTLEKAGAMSVLLECVPAKVTEVITVTLKVPTIGIGCGVDCDGQVLVVNDLLGWNDNNFRFLKKYDSYYQTSKKHFESYNSDVKSKIFPNENNIFRIKEDEFNLFEENLAS